jgi:hypothetical protein
MAGELGFDTGPYVSLATFCDQVIKGDDGALSLIRIIDSMNIQAAGPEAPDELPGGLANATMVLSLRAGKALGAQTVGISLERPDGTTKSGGEMSVNFSPGQHGGINLILPLQIEVASAGLYWANVFVNKRLMTRVPLQINYSFTRLPPPSDPSA